MLLKKLELTAFRNYSEESIDFAEGSTLIHGCNGEGKTNLLESIFILQQGHSFRTRKLSETLPWNENAMLIRCETSIEGQLDSIGLKYTKRGEKEVSINGERSNQLSKLLGLWPVVAMGPGDIELAQGAPALRRRFIDSNLCQIDPKYLDDLRRYQHVIKQRNQLLKDSIKYPPAAMVTYSVQLAQLGASITSKRQSWLTELAPVVCEFYNLISQKKETLSLKYLTQFHGDLNEIEKKILEEMDRKHSTELMLGTTTVGPHKDDMGFDLNGKKLRDFGSQGQQRTFTLALKLGLAYWLKSWKGKDPLVLLDDVFAELDPSRKEALVEYALSFKQVLLTTPLEESLGIKTDHHLKIEAGKVTF